MRLRPGPWVGAAALLALLFGGWRLHRSRTYQLLGEIVPRVETTDSIVALTFDDGPWPPYTDSVLATLARKGVRATFFVIGQGLRDHPEAGRRIVAAGHELGNHSFSHRYMVFKSVGFAERELAQTDRLIRAAGHRGPIHFRAPYGRKLVLLPYVLWRSGRKDIMWDLEPDSYPEIARDSARIVEYVERRARPGSILLLHLFGRSHEAGRKALPAVIDRLRARGYRLTTVDELLAHAARTDDAD
ncbi:MAG TPA: polysaccharide deacetylase family protein [Longimicrobiales bacterium]|nr:polysaccharide deacetylase family protein [Longimicrobiales bacterium]